MNTVLFVCTGNYYRSRYAEERFNFFAPGSCPQWRATSRGCALHLGTKNVGPIAIEAARQLEAEGVASFDRAQARLPRQVSVADLDAADRIVFLDETEHRPLMREHFGAWLAKEPVERVEWWHVHDVHLVASKVALPQIAAQVADLQARLNCGRTSACDKTS